MTDTGLGLLFSMPELRYAESEGSKWEIPNRAYHVEARLRRNFYHNGPSQLPDLKQKYRLSCLQSLLCGVGNVWRVRGHFRRLLFRYGSLGH